MWTNVRLPFEPCGHENGRSRSLRFAEMLADAQLRRFRHDGPARTVQNGFRRAQLDAAIADLSAGSTSSLPQ